MSETQSEELKVAQELQEEAYGNEDQILSISDLQSRVTKLDNYISKVERRIFKRQQQIDKEINIDEKNRELVEHGVRLMTNKDTKFKV